MTWDEVEQFELIFSLCDWLFTKKTNKQTKNSGRRMLRIAQFVFNMLIFMQLESILIKGLHRM